MDLLPGNISPLEAGAAVVTIVVLAVGVYLARRVFLGKGYAPGWCWFAILFPELVLVLAALLVPRPDRMERLHAQVAADSPELARSEAELDERTRRLARLALVLGLVILALRLVRVLVYSGAVGA